MKVLMITQKIDASDDVLGVYQEWARKISESFEKLSVICLYEGVNNLPENIKVFSLGKEKGGSRFIYIKNFFSYIWRLRNDYDIVFVHMNPIYVILGWPFWVISGKNIFLFYAHYKTGYMLRAASFFCNNILTSVPESCGLKSKKIKVVGQGIDTDTFCRDNKYNRSASTFLFVGRISPVKKLDVLIDALFLLVKEGQDVALSIVGGADYGDKEYFNSIRRNIRSYNLEGRVDFIGRVPNKSMAKFYNEHEFLINLTETGSFDKAILEAMACECLPIVSNKAYENIFPQDLQSLLIFPQDNSEILAEKIKEVMKMSYRQKLNAGNRLREIVVENHSLNTLGNRLYSIFTKI